MNKALIVGAGITGATAARILSDNGWFVEIHESQSFVGGNLKTEFINNVMYEAFGAHISHTDNDQVISFLQKFSEWIPYKHVVKTIINDQVMSWPPQINELKKIKEWKNISSELNNLPKNPIFDNFETYCISIMGETIYNLFIMPYTIKQWKTKPSELSYSFAPKRIDLRKNDNLLLFSNKWQGFPKNGWSSLIEKIINSKNIDLYMGIKDNIYTIDWYKYDSVIVTAPLDEFLGVDRLTWRGVRLEHRYIPDILDCALPSGVVNYPSLDKDYTRIIETKHMSGQANNINGTVISYEYPDDNFKHYPVYDSENINKKNALKIKNILINEFPNAIPAGRLANYVYIDTDQAILQGINAAKKAIKRSK